MVFYYIVLRFLRQLCPPLMAQCGWAMTRSDKPSLSKEIHVGMFSIEACPLPCCGIDSFISMFILIPFGCPNVHMCLLEIIDTEAS